MVKDEPHPLIRELIAKLPEPGSDWPAPQRAKWLRAAVSVFDLVYEGEGMTKVAIHASRPTDEG